MACFWLYFLPYSVYVVQGFFDPDIFDIFELHEMVVLPNVLDRMFIFPTSYLKARQMQFALILRTLPFIHVELLRTVKEFISHQLAVIFKVMYGSLPFHCWINVWQYLELKYSVITQALLFNFHITEKYILFRISSLFVCFLTS